MTDHILIEDASKQSIRTLDFAVKLAEKLGFDAAVDCDKGDVLLVVAG